MSGGKCALVRDYYARLDAARCIPVDLCAPTMLTHFGAVQGLSIVEADRLGAPFYEAFPDLRHRVIAQVGAGDDVASRLVLEGTHVKPLDNVAPSGVKVSVPAIAMHRFVGERVAEQWIITDVAGLLGQISPPFRGER